MNNRQKLILTTLLKNHIETGMPVSSGTIARESELDVSTATVRSEMACLEEDGYIIQPHTSAGRIPTRIAYEWLISNLENREINKKDAMELEVKLNNLDEFDIKQTAKELAKKSGLAVFWASDHNNLYYTGISNLLQQPEFAHDRLLGDISEMIDSLDEIINEVFDKVQIGPQIMFGDDNPFGNFCGAVVTKYRLGNEQGVIGIFGPLRMDYGKGMQLIKFLQKKLNNNYGD
ncbi:MAG: hypothetical protein ABIG10_01335 [bacterium]